jgi:hypothetical protein
MTRPTTPAYVRLLRLRHLRLRPATAFLLFEGSVALGLLLALAEFISWWGAFVVPTSVAFMVKLNDVIATALVRPLALSQLRTPRPARPRAVGRSRVTRPAYAERSGLSGRAGLPGRAGTAAGGDPARGTAGRGWRGPVIARGVAAVPPGQPT